MWKLNKIVYIVATCVYLSAFANAGKVFITERACVLVLIEILKHLHFSTFESDHAWLLA